MSKSFCVDLLDYSLVLPIGGTERSLERGLDTLDLISVLMDEGFTQFSRFGTTYHRMRGIDKNSFREQIATASLGVPRESSVCIRKLGVGNAGRYLVTFNY